MYFRGEKPFFLSKVHKRFFFFFRKINNFLLLFQLIFSLLKIFLMDTRVGFLYDTVRREYHNNFLNVYFKNNFLLNFFVY